MFANNMDVLLIYNLQRQVKQTGLTTFIIFNVQGVIISVSHRATIDDGDRNYLLLFFFLAKLREIADNVCK